MLVTPYVGVWIEIAETFVPFSIPFTVTPYVGVWIEMTSRRKSESRYRVTPYVGVWIEIHSLQC